MEDLLKHIATEIYNHSLPRPYDWLVLAAMLVSIIVAILVAIFTFIIFKKQTGISKKQSEIMEQQNKIALFEKRFEAYTKFIDLHMLGARSLTGNVEDNALFESSYKEFESRALSYLFDEDIHSKCYKLLSSLLALNRHQAVSKSNMDPAFFMLPENSQCLVDIAKDVDFYELCKEMQEYLKL